MENSWQRGASGSRGDYQVTYTPGIDLSGPYDQEARQAYERPPPQAYNQPPPHPCEHHVQYAFEQQPHVPYEQPQRDAQQTQGEAYDLCQGVHTQDKGKRNKPTSKRDKNYLSLEDETLCSAYLNVSKDSIVGTSQGSNAFWARITNYFNEFKKSPIERSSNSLQHRWGDIKRETALFGAFYSEIERRNQSGKNEDDKIKDALQLYEGKYNKPFKFLHCWLILRHEQKWNELLAGTGTQNTPDSGPHEAGNEGQPTEPTTASGIMERPMGRDRSKKQRTSSGGSNSSACFEMLQKMQLDRINFEEYMKAANKDECEAMSSRSDRKLELQEKQLEIATRAQLTQEKIYGLQQKQREDKVMLLDLEKMQPWVREYYITQQKAIALKSAADLAAQGTTTPQGP